MILERELYASIVASIRALGVRVYEDPIERGGLGPHCCAIGMGAAGVHELQPWLAIATKPGVSMNMTTIDERQVHVTLLVRGPIECASVVVI